MDQGITYVHLSGAGNSLDAVVHVKNTFLSNEDLMKLVFSDWQGFLPLSCKEKL
jgi:hypothetical protein